jgi:Na+/phosphate symporter
MALMLWLDLCRDERSLRQNFGSCDAAHIGAHVSAAVRAVQYSDSVSRMLGVLRIDQNVYAFAQWMSDIRLVPPDGMHV